MLTGEKYGTTKQIKSDTNNPYHVQLQINGKNTVLGKFSDVDEAGAYAEEMRQKYYKDFAGENDRVV